MLFRTAGIFSDLKGLALFDFPRLRMTASLRWQIGLSLIEEDANETKLQTIYLVFQEKEKALINETENKR